MKKYERPCERGKQAKRDYRVRAYAADEHKVQALRVNVYRSNCDCTNNGVSKQFDTLLVIGVEGPEEVDVNNPPPNAVWLCVKECNDGSLFYYVAPFDSADCGKDTWYCNGGNFCATSDSRWTIRYALPIFDRNEGKKRIPKEDLKPFEIMFICLPDEELTDKVTNNLASYIVNSGCNVVKIDKWGERRLAYEIDGNETGRYTLITFDADKGTVKELDRLCKGNTNILRHMIVQKGE